MISCTEFIPTYSELFKFIEDNEGYEGVVKYWEFVSDKYVAGMLGKEIEKSGLAGCFDYWAKALNEEAADFTMTLDPDEGLFEIDMHYCPSKGRLIKIEGLEPYHDYCGHCDLLYRRVVERYGFEYGFDAANCDKAMCKLSVREKKN